MSQPRIGIPFKIIDNPEVGPSEIFLWAKLVVLQTRQKTDSVDLGKGFKRIRQITGFKTKTIRSLIENLTDFGYAQLTGEWELTLIDGAKYPGKNSRKEPEPYKPKDPPPTEPEPNPETNSEAAPPVAAGADDGAGGDQELLIDDEVVKPESTPPRQETAVTDWLEKSMCGYPAGWKGLLEYWNQVANETGMPTVKYMTKRRKAGAIQRIRDKEFPDPDELYAAIREQSDFLGGERTGWRADYDWIFCCKTNWPKVMERKYVQKNGNGKANQRKTAAEENAERLKAMYEGEEEE